jgi:hypothetical protein
VAHHDKVTGASASTLTFFAKEFFKQGVNYNF